MLEKCKTSAQRLTKSYKVGATISLLREIDSFGKSILL